MASVGDIAPFDWPADSKLVYPRGAGFGALMGTRSVYQKLPNSAQIRQFEAKVEKAEAPIPLEEEKKQTAEETPAAEFEATEKERQKEDEWDEVETKKRRLF